MADERGALAYLVRLWSVHHDGNLVWRASAENAHTGERHAFADLAALCQFLQTAVQEAAVWGEPARSIITTPPRLPRHSCRSLSMDMIPKSRP